MEYFTSKNAGARYDKYRPKVHGVVLDWLALSFPGRRFHRGVDIACGTGDSLKPLGEICEEVIGIDSSAEMLSIAMAQGLPVIKGDYRNMSDVGTFDLLSTCMAFHWFDPALAVASYKAASRNGAIWLIYNFALDGHETSAAFNDWYFNSYFTRYPSPPRNRSAVITPGKDQSLTLIKQDQGCLAVNFTAEFLVGYLSTQSNIEQVLKSGRPVESVVDELLSQVAEIDLTGTFKYKFSYELYEYTSC